MTNLYNTIKFWKQASPLSVAVDSSSKNGTLDTFAKYEMNLQYLATLDCLEFTFS